MQKFSLYDILTVLFPGILFLFMLNKIRQIFGFFPRYNLTEQWDVIIVLSFLLGTFIYVISFSCIKTKLKFLYTWSKIYQHVTVLFYKCQFPTFLYKQLNKKSTEWYTKEIFPRKEEYLALTDNKKKEIRHLQDEFYDRMYYELDYNQKLNVAITFQSFYLFFRNLFIASTFSIILLIILILTNSICPFTDTGNEVWCMLAELLFVITLSIFIGRWYRQRMVYKMYWYFYSYINDKNK